MTMMMMMTRTSGCRLMQSASRPFDLTISHRLAQADLEKLFTK